MLPYGIGLNIYRAVNLARYLLRLNSSHLKTDVSSVKSAILQWSNDCQKLLAIQLTLEKVRLLGGSVPDRTGNTAGESDPKPTLFHDTLSVPSRINVYSHLTCDFQQDFRQWQDLRMVNETVQTFHLNFMESWDGLTAHLSQ